MMRAAAVLLISATVALSAPPKLTKVADTVADATALYLPDGRWGHTTNGRSFQQDAVASFNGWQYATWFDSERRLCVGRRPLEAMDWQVIRFQDYHFKGNDTHNAPVLGICPADGTIHLSFDHHGHPLHYRVSRLGIATEPQNTDWSAALFGPTTNQLQPGRPLKRVTYPRFFAMPTGELQFQCRIGGSGDGAAWLAEYANGKWTNFAAFIAPTGVLGASRSRNAYENGYTYDRSGRLHVTWCWRETSHPMTNHDLLYAYSDDRCATWRNNAGEVIGIRGKQLLDLDSPGLRVWEIPQGRGLINSTTQAIDGRGRVHVITRHLPDGVPAAVTWEQVVPATKFFHYWRDESGKWSRIGMPFGGNRGQLCFDADDNAYHIFVAGTLQIAAASAEKQWTDWRVIHREPGRFTDQPVFDLGRAREQQILSIYIQEAPDGPEEKLSPLRVIDFRLGASE